MPSSCLYSAHTRQGKVRLDDPNQPVFARLPDGTGHHITRADQLRRLEVRHGRVELYSVDGDTTTEHGYSKQANATAVSGRTQTARRYGPDVDTLAAAARTFGVAHSTADRLIRAVAAAERPSVAARTAAAALAWAPGAPNRWARQIATAIKADPDRLAATLAALDSPTTGGLAPRDLEGLHFAGDIARAVKRGLADPDDPITEDDLDEAERDSYDALHHLIDEGGSWAQTRRVHDTGQPVTLTGYKLHVATGDSDDLRATVTAVVPALIRAGLLFKTATAQLADRDDHPHAQARKGITVYLTSRADAAEAARYVAAHLPAGRTDRRAPGDDVDLGSGIGMRFELAYDPGHDISEDDYFRIYTASSTITDPDATARLAALRRTIAAAPVDHDALMGALHGTPAISPALSHDGHLREVISIVWCVQAGAPVDAARALWISRSHPEAVKRWLQLHRRAAAAVPAVA